MKGPAEHHLVGSRGRELRLLVWTPDHPIGRVQLVHGFSEHIARYDHVARRLAEEGWAVFGHDLPGHGASEGRKGVLERFDDLVDDLRTVAEAGPELTGVSGPGWTIGHSLGALVTIRHLQTGGDPGVGVVLSAPWLDTAVDIPLVKRIAGAVLWRLAPDMTIPNTIDPTALSRDPEVQARRMVDPLAHSRVSAGLFERCRTAQEAARASGLPGDAPVLVIIPGDDRVADAGVTEQWTASMGDRVDVMRLPEVRHEPFNDTARNEILNSLVEWMTTLRESDTGPTRDVPPAGDMAGHE